MKFSVVIPTLNEESFIQGCIDRVRNLDADADIIVSDGGSSDRTAQIASKTGTRVINSERGRGRQCNAGAVAATGEVLVFLHADTRLPDDAFLKLHEIFSDERVQCGTFRLSFDSGHWFLRLLSLLSFFDLGFFRFGDQCLVIRRSFFDSLGGFPSWPLFEDMELVRRARRKTQIRRFPMAVTTSARRFLENGVLRQQARNTWYTIQYLIGVSPETLACRYQKPRPEGDGLILFLRYPGRGEVKTRLSAGIGREAAVAFYRECAWNLVGEARKLPSAVSLGVWYTGGTAEEMGEWLGRDLRYLPQPDGDLGERLAFAFEFSFREGARKTIVVASDVPELSARLISIAFKELDRCDLVIGPNVDGGYYLLGTRKPCPALFQGIPWSTDAVCRQTVDVARRLGLTVRMLPELSDIDTRDDLLAWQRRNRRRSPLWRVVRELELERR